VQDLRQTVSTYWLIRQWRNRLHRESFGRKLNLFWEERLNQHAYNIGKAIMRARAIEITKEKAA
jgi:hypothetical protein